MIRAKIGATPATTAELRRELRSGETLSAGAARRLAQTYAHAGPHMARLAAGDYFDPAAARDELGSICHLVPCWAYAPMVDWLADRLTS